MMYTVLEIGGAAGLHEACSVLRISRYQRSSGGRVVLLLVGQFIFVDSTTIKVDCHG